MQDSNVRTKEVIRMAAQLHGAVSPYAASIGHRIQNVAKKRKEKRCISDTLVLRDIPLRIDCELGQIMGYARF